MLISEIQEIFDLLPNAIYNDTKDISDLYRDYTLEKKNGYHDLATYEIHGVTFITENDKVKCVLADKVYTAEEWIESLHGDLKQARELWKKKHEI